MDYTPPPSDHAPPPPPPRQDVPNYLVQAILTTLCCCLPAGVVAIIYAAQVNTKRDQGDIAGAWEASKKAKTWTWVAFGLGIVWWIFIVSVNGLAFLAALAGA